MPEIYDMRMHDGSRHFAALPTTYSWHTLRRHIEKLKGVSDTGLLTDDVTEAWIDFRYRGHAFSVNNQFGEYWFFVEDPACPEEVLEAVLSHCKLLLGED
jgi:hypothetical protein